MTVGSFGAYPVGLETHLGIGGPFRPIRELGGPLGAYLKGSDTNLGPIQGARRPFGGHSGALGPIWNVTGGLWCQFGPIQVAGRPIWCLFSGLGGPFAAIWDRRPIRLEDPFGTYLEGPIQGAWRPNCGPSREFWGPWVNIGCHRSI